MGVYLLWYLRSHKTQSTLKLLVEAIDVITVLCDQVYETLILGIKIMSKTSQYKCDRSKQRTLAHDAKSIVEMAGNLYKTGENHDLAYRELQEIEKVIAGKITKLNLQETASEAFKILANINKDRGKTSEASGYFLKAIELKYSEDSFESLVTLSEELKDEKTKALAYQHKEKSSTNNGNSICLETDKDAQETFWRTQASKSKISPIMGHR